MLSGVNPAGLAVGAFGVPTDDAPWYIVPADRKWVRNLVVAKIFRHHLDVIDPSYPPAEQGIEGVVAG